MQLTEVCQSRQPLSLKRLYRRREVYRYNGRMRQALKVHPDSLCSAVTHIEVEIMRPCAGSLVFSYLVTGRIGDLRIPAAVAAARTDELFRGIRPHFARPRLLRIQLCALNTMGGLSVRQLPKRNACCNRDKRAPH